MPDGAGRQRIAILGGGIASLAAAWELTSQEGWGDRYEITVYQQGWRLGGKGASGRNAGRGARIEEHGLHVWFGCYDNAFRMLGQCYDEIPRTSKGPFPSVWDAFFAQDHTPVMEYADGSWHVWPVTYPRTKGRPGCGTGAKPWAIIVKLLKFAEESFDRWQPKARIAPPVRKRRLLKRVVRELPEVRPEDHPLRQFRSIAESAYADPTRPYGRGVFWLLNAYRTWRRRFAIARGLREFKRWLDVTALPQATADSLRRMLIGIDLAITIVQGFLSDLVLLFGTDHLDREDLRAWLTRHGAQEESVWSAPVRALYDLCFAYEHGETGTGQPKDPGRPNFAAGTALECALRIGLTYEGAVCYEMRSGMGEVVFAPIYEALRRRGVRFQFFHRVKRLELASNGKSVKSVHIGRQVRLKDGEYEPLVEVNGLRCWPAEPDCGQIENGESLKGIDLEFPPYDWKDVEELELKAGEDFNHIVLGIPIAVLDEICSELIQRSRRWRNMVKHVKTVRTLSLQLWLTRDLRQLGWLQGPVPVNAAPEPIDVWADMSHLLSREAWPARRRPRSLQYLCGPLSERHGADARGHDRVRAMAEAWLQRYAGALWPRAVTSARGKGFDWSVLHDPKNRKGPARLDAQYLRANVHPSDRYVLSVAGSTKYRLAADESGFGNLFLAGDWTRTSYNAGCIEAAVISGINAARAASGLGRGGGCNPFYRGLRFIGALVARALVLPVIRRIRL